MKYYNYKNRIRIINIVFIIFLNASFCFAMEDIEVIKIAKDTSVYIIAKFEGQPSQSGTGFIIDTVKSPGLAVITNKHIVQKRTKDGFIGANEILVKVNLSETQPSVYSATVVKLHNTYDVAFLRLEKLVTKPDDIEVKITGERKFHELKTKAFLLENHIIDESEIKEGLKVFFSGYPLGLNSERIKNFPITRKGTIAQVLPGEDELIIDGMCSSGNSGSPVFCSIGNSIKVLGVMKGNYPDSYYEYDEKGTIIGIGRFNSGLAVAIKAFVVKSFVYELIDKKEYKGDWSD